MEGRCQYAAIFIKFPNKRSTNVSPERYLSEFPNFRINGWKSFQPSKVIHILDLRIMNTFFLTEAMFHFMSVDLLSNCRDVGHFDLYRNCSCHHLRFNVVMFNTEESAASQSVQLLLSDWPSPHTANRDYSEYYVQNMNSRMSPLENQVCTDS